MRQAGLGGRPAGRTSALCFGERPQRPAGPRHQPGLGSDPDSARGFSVRHLERPAGAAGRDPGCVRRSSGSRSAHACVRSPASARTPSRLQTCPCAPCLRPVSTAAGSKAGEQVCHPSHRDLPLLPRGSSVWRLVSRDSVRAWSSHGGGWEACGSPRPPWDGRPGWGHAGVTRGSHLVVASPLVTAHQ